MPNAALETSVKSAALLVATAVCTVNFASPVTPAGTVVRMNASAQSVAALAIVAGIGVPPVGVKNTFPSAVGPKLVPAIT